MEESFADRLLSDVDDLEAEIEHRKLKIEYCEWFISLTKLSRSKLLSLKESDKRTILYRYCTIQKSCDSCIFQCRCEKCLKKNEKGCVSPFKNEGSVEQFNEALELIFGYRDKRKLISCSKSKTRIYIFDPSDRFS